MLKGIHLTLLVGPVVVFPVPKIVMDALQSVKVTSSAGAESASGFELKFTFSAQVAAEHDLPARRGAVAHAAR